MLYQYGQFYKQLHELPSTDRPSDDIINDDVALDSWYKNYLADIARRSARAAGKAAGQPQVNIPTFTG